MLQEVLWHKTEFLLPSIDSWHIKIEQAASFPSLLVRKLGTRFVLWVAAVIFTCSQANKNRKGKGKQDTTFNSNNMLIDLCSYFHDREVLHCWIHQSKRVANSDQISCALTTQNFHKPNNIIKCKMQMQKPVFTFFSGAPVLPSPPLISSPAPAGFVFAPAQPSPSLPAPVSAAAPPRGDAAPLPSIIMIHLQY